MSTRISFYVWVFYPENAAPVPAKVQTMAEAIKQCMKDAAVFEYTVGHSLKVSSDQQPFVEFEVKTDLDFADDVDCSSAVVICSLLRVEALLASQTFLQLEDLNCFWSNYEDTEPAAA